MENKLTGDDSKLAVELNFKHIDDFEPASVASRSTPLRKLLEMRQRLTELLAKMEGNDKLEALLADGQGHRKAVKKLKPAPAPAAATADGGARCSPDARRSRAGSRRGRRTSSIVTDGKMIRDDSQQAARARPGAASSSTRCSTRAMVVCDDVETTIKTRIAQIDKLLSASSTRSCTHPSSRSSKPPGAACTTWCRTAETGKSLKIALLNVTKKELFKDLEKAVEFDQSALFKKVYEEEYGTSAASRTACSSATTSSAGTRRTSSCSR